MDTSALQFDISPSSGVPIYLQIIDQVQALIAGGRLQPGDLLPSVRRVAEVADVNPMTVSKAYSRLEAERVVQRVRGQGMRVAANNPDGSVAERKAQLQEVLSPALHRASQLGLTEKQVRAVIESLLKDYRS